MFLESKYHLPSVLFIKSSSGKGGGHYSQHETIFKHYDGSGQSTRFGIEAPRTKMEIDNLKDFSNISSKGVEQTIEANYLTLLKTSSKHVNKAKETTKNNQRAGIWR